MEKVIVEYGYGSFSVYKGTLQNAKNILERVLPYMTQEVLEIYNSKCNILNKKNIIHVVNKILSLKEGEMASKTIAVTKENKQELVLYCYEKSIPIENSEVDEYVFFEKANLSDLSFFNNNDAYPKDAKIIDDYVIDQLSKYKVIKEDRWKETATEKGKIQYVLSFARDLSNDDVKYDLVDLESVAE